MQKKNPRTPVLAVVTLSLVCLAGLLGVLPRESELTTMQIAAVVLFGLSLLGINVWVFRLSQYCRNLLDAGS